MGSSPTCGTDAPVNRARAVVNRVRTGGRETVPSRVVEVLLKLFNTAGASNSDERRRPTQRVMRVVDFSVER